VQFICIYLQMCADEAECECEVGDHCDVWGIGCLTYHMMMGVPIDDDVPHEPYNEIPNQVQLGIVSVMCYILVCITAVGIRVIVVLLLNDTLR